MTETDEHPEFNAELTMEDGTVITLHAAEGVLPADRRPYPELKSALMYTKPDGHLLRSEMALISNIARTIKDKEEEKAVHEEI